MKALFTKEALDASEFKIIKNNIEYIQTCAGKVNIKYKTKNIIGYILEKNKEKWKILLSNNQIIHTDSLKYNKDTKKYNIYPSGGKY